MTLAEVKAIRDKYYEALLATSTTAVDHSIDGASYNFNATRESLEKSLEYWDKMYNAKLSGGVTRRMNVKAV